MEKYKKVGFFDSFYNGENLEIECTAAIFGKTIYLGAGLTRARVLNSEVIKGLKNKQRLITYGTEKIIFEEGCEFGIFEFSIDSYKILE